MTDVLEFQVLALAVRIEGADAEVGEQLRYLVQRARQPHPPTVTARFEVGVADGRYVVTEDGREVSRQHLPRGVLDVLYQRVHRRALDGLAGMPVLHAGSAVVGGARVLVVGPSRSGKSCLMTRLLFEGERAEGDEMVVVTPGGVTAFPRRFHLKHDAPAVVPEVSGLVAGLPSIVGRGGDRVWALDPTEAGFGWRIEEGPVDVIVALQPNHGGETRLRPCPRYEMVRTLMENVLVPDVGGAGIGPLAALVDGARCFRACSESLCS